MIVYNSTKRGFLDDVFNGKIANCIQDAFIMHLGRSTSDNEVRSWKNSMMAMQMVMNTENIPDDADICIEYQLPLTSKRVDFIISGSACNSGKHEDNVVIIELKQWEKAEVTDMPGIVSTRFQSGPANTTHPSYQAWSYAYLLENFNSTVQEKNIKLYPCAFAHNYEGEELYDERYTTYLDQAPLFNKQNASTLQEFITEKVKEKSSSHLIKEIEFGHYRPSKQLADALASMLEGKSEFELIDDQKVVYERALSAASNAIKSYYTDKDNFKKKVMIVSGGPGTGKSVVAINLLVELTVNHGASAVYVTKNQAPRDVYAAKLGGGAVFNSLFTGSGVYIDKEKNEFDTLIVDEAHRLCMRSGLYGNLGDNQIKEIINAAKFSVFFVDDHQKVHVRDTGSVESIKRYAKECGAKVIYTELESQFRCGGSDGYLSWIDNCLQIRQTANVNLDKQSYDFKVFDSPEDMFDAIKAKNTPGKNLSKTVAGYCWNWVSRNDPSSYDITIGSFQKRWNLATDGARWILADNDEIGCIHTCQGLEMDYVGVIIGKDLRYEDGEIVTDALERARSDQSIRGLRTRVRNNDAEALNIADDIIKNTYRTLMTRGMKGCYVYCCDTALADYIKSRLALEIAPETPVNSIRVESEVNDNVKYLDFLPLYSMKAACGHFGDGETVEQEGWIDVTRINIKPNRNEYIVRASGHSMEPRISDGDYCIFSVNSHGGLDGKIVLVEHTSYDSDNQGCYSIKKYEAEYGTIDGKTGIEKVKLVPLNPSFRPIVIDAKDEANYRIVGYFVDTIN